MINRKILIISRNAWCDENSTGNTLSNFFGDWNPDLIANIFCREEIPTNKICKLYFKITENDLVRSIFGRKQAGEKYFFNKNISPMPKLHNSAVSQKKVYDQFRKHRWYLFLWMRELLWKCGTWRNNKLNQFVEQFNPDLIYTHIYDSFYMHDLLEYISSLTNARVILYTGDNNYSFSQGSKSPLFYVNQLILRQKIRQSIMLSELCYCGSRPLLEYYQNQLRGNFRIIFKGGLVGRQLMPKQLNRPIKLVFTGNVIYGRWRTLSWIGEVLDNLNVTQESAILEIYTMSTLTKEMQRAFRRKSIKIMGGVSATLIPEIQRTADVLVHVESFRLKEIQKVQYSFSTKIVDYLASNSCIFAVGKRGVSSIDYLHENDAAIIATSKEDIRMKLSNLVKNGAIIDVYREKAWICAKQNHDIFRLWSKIAEDMVN